jgi:hypothetical protein
VSEVLDAEVAATGRLLGAVAAAVTRRAARLHEGVAERVFSSVALGTGGRAVAPVRVAHDALSHTAYRVVGGTLTLAGTAGGSLAAPVVADDRSALEYPGWGRAAGVLGGLFGDWAAAEVPELTPPMVIRRRGAAVPPTTTALAAAFPRPTEHLVVFLHGLVETEAWWRRGGQRGYGHHGEWYGSRLQRDLGCNAVEVRYTSGLRVSDNGQALAALLADLVEAWPVPVRSLDLVGHSMGGLVIRSALVQSRTGLPDAAPWTRRVRHTVTLGAPHLGAPLEQGVAWAVPVMRRVPELRWLADVLAARSVGIKDLRHGNLLQDHWAGLDPDGPSERPPVAPLHDGVRDLVVLGTWAREHDSVMGHLLGDLLVRPHSALGDTGAADAWGLGEDQVLRLGSAHHLALLADERVYARLVEWLGTGPWEGPGSPAEPSTSED